MNKNFMHGNWYGESVENYIFFKKSSKISTKNNESFQDFKYPWDQVHTYRHNSDGYRSPELSAETKLLFSGCSFTHGDGVAEPMIWGTKVADSLGYSYANLGVPGASCYHIVQDIFSYFDKYGHPEVLLCLFPETSRFVSVSVDGLFTEGIPTDGHNKIVHSQSKYGSGLSDFAPKYVKKPYNMAEVVPEEFSTMLSIHAINFLHLYCKTVGIKFYWSTWYKGISSYLDVNAKLFPPGSIIDSYIDIENDHWHTHSDNESKGYYHPVGFQGPSCIADECKVWATCHLDLKEQWPDNFHIGTDVSNNRRHSHWGVHRHAHIAEAFLKKL